MRSTTASEIPKLENNEIIMHMEGSFTKIWDYKEGDNDKGHWSFQNAEFKDDTGTVKVKLVNQPDRQPIVHRPLSITAHNGNKGYTGIYAFDDSYTNKSGKTVETRLVKITATGQIEIAGEKKEVIPAKETTVELDTDEATKTIRRKLMQVMNGFMLVERAVHAQVEAAEKEGIDCDLSNFGGKCSSAYRELNGLISKLPDDHPIWIAKELPKEEIEKVFPRKEIVQGAMNSSPEFEEEIPF